MVDPISNALFSRGENPMNSHFTPSGSPVPLQLYGIVWHGIAWYGIAWHGMALATWQGGYEWHRSKENVICLVSLATVNPIPLLTISCLLYSLISLPKCLKTHSEENPNQMQSVWNYILLAKPSDSAHFCWYLWPRLTPYPLSFLYVQSQTWKLSIW